MKIVIDIFEDDYNKIKNKHINSCTLLEQLVKQGTVLPKGHGRLVDEKEVTKAVRPYVSFSDLYDVMKEVHTVVEPDYTNKEEDNG